MGQLAIFHPTYRGYNLIYNDRRGPPRSKLPKHHGIGAGGHKLPLAGFSVVRAEPHQTKYIRIIFWMGSSHLQYKSV